MKNLSRFATSAIALLALVLAVASCNHFKAGGHKHLPDPKNQVVVLFKQNTSEDRKQNFRNLVRQNFKRDFDVFKCHCDLQLELWRGDNIAALITDTTVIKGEISPTSRTGVTGDDTVYLSLNVVDTLKDSGSGSGRMQYVAPNTSRQVIIAVLDTGIDTTMFSSGGYQQFLLRPGETHGACGGAQRFAGWNFIDSNHNFLDDNAGRHGTQVTGLILQEGVKNRIRILPLKTHARNGLGNLFQSICAMKYASKAGANLINASWGSYGIPNRLFEQALTELNNQGVVMVSAAGNDNLNISNHPFYPAAYSGRTGDANMHPNLISVTTVQNTGICTTNFSPERVDVGALGKSQDCRFNSPFSNTVMIGGSSFATPVITGMLANNFPYSGGGTLKEQMLRTIDPLAAVSSVSEIRTRKGFKQR